DALPISTEIRPQSHTKNRGGFFFVNLRAASWRKLIRIEERSSDRPSSRAAPESSRPATRSTHAAPSRRRRSVDPFSVLPSPWSLSRKLQRKVQLLVHAAQQIRRLCLDRVLGSSST